MTSSFRKRYLKNRSFLEWYDEFVPCVVLVALVFTFVVRLVRVDGSSMKPTLIDDDRILITSCPYTPDYGDIVVIDSYIPHGRPLVKRVIGLAGDTIDIDFVNGVVYRNGAALDEPYTAAPTYSPEGMTFPLVVEEGTVFVMGDNRNESMDSRDPEIGLVDERDVLGKALFRLMPFSQMGALE